MIKLFVSFIFAILFVGCSSQFELSKQDMQKTYYTQANIWFIKRASSYSDQLNESVISSKYTASSINHKTRILLPINSAIKVIKFVDNIIFFEYKNETYAYVRTKYGKHLSLANSFKSLFSQEKSKVKLTQDILRGNIVEGMTKEEVFASRGFPPSHKTKSLANRSWNYWDSRRYRQHVIFSNNKVTEVLINGRWR